MIELFKSLFEKERESILSDYFTFLKFKSIATDPAYRTEVEACAAWLTHYLGHSSFTVEMWETERAPVIFVHDLRAGPTKETLLIYCHYDVQPVDPLNEWISPPFEPRVDGGEVYARGASDNKGQCFYTILALKTLQKLQGTLNVNIKLLIEGEEESGSIGLSKLLAQKQAALKADHLLIVDSGVESLESPAITLGARGIVCMQVEMQEAAFDLHSGFAGGLAYNPNRALVELLSKLHDDKGRVALPGFYDEITPPSPEERSQLSLDFDETQFHRMFGFKPTGMEEGFKEAEVTTLRPTLEINGIWGGYTGPGFKTVIPAKAYAKLSCRLVPNQNPDTIATLVKEFLIKNAPKELQTHVTLFPGSGRGFRTNPNSRLAQLMRRSYSEIFQKPCKNILIGGTLPIAVDLCHTAQAEMVLVGLGLPDDHIHAPNEHFGLNRLEKGFLTICRAIELFD